MKVNINGVILDTSTAETTELESLIKNINKILSSIDEKLKSDVIIKNSSRKNELLLKRIRLEKVKKECSERIEKRKFKKLVGTRKKQEQQKAVVQ